MATDIETKYDLALDYSVWLIAVCEKAGVSVPNMLASAPDAMRSELAKRWRTLVSR